MLTFILTTAGFNLCLGYALAVYLRHRTHDFALAPAVAPAHVPSLAPQLLAADIPPAPEPATTAEPLASITAPEEIPMEWVEKLRAESINAQSFVEASAHVLQLEVGKYREALLVLEDEVRRYAQDPVPGQVEGVVRRFVDLNRYWLAEQSAARGHLAAAEQSLDQFADVGVKLQTVLMEQASQIGTSCHNVERLDLGKDFATACATIIGELAGLADLAHELRDRVAEALMATLRVDDRLAELSSEMRSDSLTGLNNRAGMELAIGNWWKEDPSRQRLACAVLLDLVDTKKMNRVWGTRFGDRVIGSLGALIEGLLRQERGYDVAGRLAGQRFLLFLGDTGPRQATTAAERFRQSIVASTLEYHGADVSVSVTCAATEVVKTDDVPALMHRLEQTLWHAKNAGGNCTSLDEGSGPTDIDPPDFKVRRAVMQIEDS